MSDLGNTQFFRVPQEQKLGVEEILEKVYEALAEKGYNPVNQIVGYIMSGDPTYIRMQEAWLWKWNVMNLLKKQ